MAHAMKPEHSRHEQFMSYAHLLTERFASGLLSELQPLQQWVVWRAEQDREGKQKKVPYNPNRQLAHASVTVPRSWGSLDQALSALQSGTYTGLGLVITPPLAFLDLDHSYDNTTGTITDPQAHELVRTLNSYTEVSPSGTGLHVFAYGNLPGRGIHTAIELYGKDRFTTITTNHLAGTPPTIAHRQAALDALYRRFAPAAASREEQNTRGWVGSSAALTELPAEVGNDPLLQKLLRGDTTGYASSSNADFVLVLKLLHWTGDNVDLTRKLFLQSGLYREGKTERKTGQTTYLDMTINNARKKRRNPPMRR
jgi:putative DNA primase/helicase